MSARAVVIAGGGPTGLMLAGELALGGVDVAIVERRVDQTLIGQRAGGLLARTLEVLDQRGIVERFLSEGQVAQVGTFAGVSLQISDFPSRHPHGLALRQRHIERILAGWIDELGVPVYRGQEVAGFAQDNAGVDVQLADGQAMRAEYLVGCDGGRSLIRKAAGIEFPGWDPTTSALLAEVLVTQEPEWGIHHTAFGRHAFAKLDDGLVGVMVTEDPVQSGDAPTLSDLKETLMAVVGTDYGVHDPLSISRFTDTTRQAASYREGRILLAGDAAHVHSPDGGQGLNLGVQDAVNLGWKLAQVVRGTSPDSLLDTYQAERHPIAATALRNTMALVGLRRADDRINALGQVAAELLQVDEARRRLAGQFSGLDIHYDLGEGHPLLGRRMPDLDLAIDGRPERVFGLMHRGRPLLLNLGDPGGINIGLWADRVRLIDAVSDGPWELPVIGPVSAPRAVLVRPDGYVAWVGDQAEDGLQDALTTWFGPPAAD